MKEARKLFWDIESSHLKAPFGHIICIGYKFEGDAKPTIISSRQFKGSFKEDHTNERAMLKDFREILNEADMWVYHYGNGFDSKMINSKLIENGLPGVDTQTPRVDTWKIAYDKLAMHSNRLDALGDYLECESQKTPLKFRIWKKATSGNVEAIKYIEKHCYYDVLLLEEVYNKIKHLSHNHPNMALLSEDREGCPTCGASRDKLKSEGFRATNKTAYRRLCCRVCGAWDHRSVRKGDLNAVHK